MYNDPSKEPPLPSWIPEAQESPSAPDAQTPTPGADGWLTFSRDLGTLYGTHIWHWTRIRWETMPHLETQELP